MMSHRKRAAKIRAIYERVPKIACKGLCADQCTVILMSATEERMMRDAGHEPPEMMTALRAKRCPLLCPSSGRCTAYEARPLICRLWGVVPEMTCPHGCQPERVLSKAQAKSIMHEVQAIGGRSVAHKLFE